MKNKTIILSFVFLFSCENKRSEKIGQTETEYEREISNVSSQQGVFQIGEVVLTEKQLLEVNGFSSGDKLEKKRILVSVISQVLAEDSQISKQDFPVIYGHVKTHFPDVFNSLTNSNESFSGADFLDLVLVKKD